MIANQAMAEACGTWYSSGQIAKFEETLLHILDWDICQVTSYEISRALSKAIKHLSMQDWGLNDSDSKTLTSLAGFMESSEFDSKVWIFNKIAILGKILLQ